MTRTTELSQHGWMVNPRQSKQITYASIDEAISYDNSEYDILNIADSTNSTYMRSSIDGNFEDAQGTFWKKISSTTSNSGSLSVLSLESNLYYDMNFTGYNGLDNGRYSATINGNELLNTGLNLNLTDTYLVLLDFINDNGVFKQELNIASINNTSTTYSIYRIGSNLDEAILSNWKSSSTIKTDSNLIFSNAIKHTYPSPVSIDSSIVEMNWSDVNYENDMILYNAQDNYFEAKKDIRLNLLHYFKLSSDDISRERVTPLYTVAKSNSMVDIGKNIARDIFSSMVEKSCYTSINAYGYSILDSLIELRKGKRLYPYIILPQLSKITIENSSLILLLDTLYNDKVMKYEHITGLKINPIIFTNNKDYTKSLVTDINRFKSPLVNTSINISKDLTVWCTGKCEVNTEELITNTIVGKSSDTAVSIGKIFNKYESKLIQEVNNVTVKVTGKTNTGFNNAIIIGTNTYLDTMPTQLITSYTSNTVVLPFGWKTIKRVQLNLDTVNDEFIYENTLNSTSSTFFTHIAILVFPDIMFDLNTTRELINLEIKPTIPTSKYILQTTSTIGDTIIDEDTSMVDFKKNISYLVFEGSNSNTFNIILDIPDTSKVYLVNAIDIGIKYKAVINDATYVYELATKRLSINLGSIKTKFEIIIGVIY